VTARGLAREPGRRPSRRAACSAVVPSRHAACLRGQARIRPPWRSLAVAPEAVAASLRGA
jgi:hypothetical protein